MRNVCRRRWKSARKRPGAYPRAETETRSRRLGPTMTVTPRRLVRPRLPSNFTVAPGTRTRWSPSRIVTTRGAVSTTGLGFVGGFGLVVLVVVGVTVVVGAAVCLLAPQPA